MKNDKKLILIADDEKEIRDVVGLLLRGEGYEVMAAEDGEGVLALASPEVDLYLLDVNMPRLSGIMAAAELRKKYDAPIVFLTAFSGESDKVMAFSAGADDYIVKPFEILELIARVESVLRRTGASADEFKVDDVTVNFVNKRVIKDGAEVFLTPREFSLLEALIKNRNIALSREKLIDLVWASDFDGDSRTVDVHIQRLRTKLGLDKRIKTLYRLGYRLEV